MQFIRKFTQHILTLLAVLLVCTACGSPPSLSVNPWQPVALPTDATPLDVGFVSPDHGWLVGTRSTLLETLDGGQTWQSRSMLLDDQDYRFTSVSFSGQEGWITGEPAILLHTTDGGKTWLRISLSSKLPGMPNTVVALGPNSAEMTTDVGAIYRTRDSGQTWKAVVQEAVGVVRNIARSQDGQYVAVSARGNFYSVWKPGDAAWEPHNRNSSKRVQNMGFNQKGQLWMLNRGGEIQFSELEQPNEWQDPINPQFGVSIGLLDLAYRTENEIWVAGGSGNLLCSFDGGKTWKKDRAVENIPSNLYKIVFVSPEQGFILGQSGTLLKYSSAAQSA